MAEEKNEGSSTSREISYYVNIENAKIVAFFTVIGFVLYHGIIHFQFGSDSCKWLISDGRFQGYNAWQPYGCMMHKYSKSDSRMCMHYISYWGGENHIAFVGDSRIRQLYYEFVNNLSNDPVPPIKAHQDLHYRDEKIVLKVDFLWQPMVNGSMFNLFDKWTNHSHRDAPNVIVTGSGTWAIKVSNGSEEAHGNFINPVIEDKLSANRSMITNEQVDKYNKVALSTLKDSPAMIWRSSRLVAQGHNSDSEDGLHIGKVALEWDSQILLNLYCNNHMNYNDGTCCNNRESVTTLQLVTAIVFALCMVAALVMLVYRRKSRRNGVKSRTASDIASGPLLPAPGHSHDSKPSKSVSENGTKSGPTYCDVIYEIVVSMAKLGVIMAYCFLCDRTNFFMKENKFYTHSNFFLPFAYVMILGFFFTDDTEQTSVLHRDQTDEWKGWMQLVILIYHYMGASQVVSVYMHIRVLVSSYLFLTGYGHFFYFWKKGDYGLFRFCQVLFRMNLLVVVLCFVMNRPYQFYYFVPLVSFWFLVVYITMAFWPHVTAATAQERKIHYFYMILKFVILGTVLSLFFLSEVFFEKIFLSRPIKPLFVLSDDSIHEWRFRWELDRYSVVYGMLFAFGYHILKKLDMIDDTNHETLFSRGITWAVTLLSVVGLGSYSAFSFLCGNKRECNSVHPYIAFIPIVSFISLRNIPGWLRSRYSSFFAWFGKISLELFIAQYHIWLAADTHGILVLVPNYPVLNVVITSFIFVCAAHEIHKVTGVLAQYAVPKDWKRILRNLILFIGVLIPVCITHGVFDP